MSNPFLDIIQNGLSHHVNKWAHYLPLYHRHFEKYKLKASPENKVHLLEIGVQNGGSLDMWSAYFGAENCIIYGLDVDPACKALERDNIKIFIGDQVNKEFLLDLKSKIPPLDIIVDDGGHLMQQQIVSLETLYDHVKFGGVYLCEDTVTSYWPNYGGGLNNPATFIEHTKKIIDHLTGYPQVGANSMARTCLSIHYYDSMVFFEKPEALISHPPAIVWPAKPTKA